MCQLLGMNSRLPASLSVSLSGFSRRGGATAEHADGWGVAFFNTEQDRPGKGVQCFLEAQPAAGSAMASMLQNHPIKTHNAVAHVRRATVGPVALANSHPFTRALWGRHWVFAHNGHLDEFNPELTGVFQPVGATDSEKAFCLILQELARSHGPEASRQEISVTLLALSARICSHGVFNFLLSNGESLWARASTKLCYTQRAYPFGQIHMTDTGSLADLSTLNGPNDRLCIVVTEPLTSNEHWVHLSDGQMAIFEDGILADLLAPLVSS
jgi:predicted glutamine amidotransferase